MVRRVVTRQTNQSPPGAPLLSKTLITLKHPSAFSAAAAAVPVKVGQRTVILEDY